MCLFIFILFSIINVIEAKLESIVIALKNPALQNYSELNRREHKWSAIYYICIVVLTTGLSILAAGFSWLAIPVILLLLTNRRVFFEYALKVFRKRSIKNIEGDQPLDITVRKLFGQKGGYRELFLLTSLMIGLCFLIIKFK